MKFPDDERNDAGEDPVERLAGIMAPVKRVKELAGPVVMALEQGEEHGIVAFQVAKSLLHYAMIRHRFSYVDCLRTLAELEIAAGGGGAELEDFYRRLTGGESENPGG